jgi:hypothetical protein
VAEGTLFILTGLGFRFVGSYFFAELSELGVHEFDILGREGITL